MSLQVNGPLRNYKLNYLNSSRSDATERNEMKRKSNCLMDYGDTNNKSLLLIKFLFLA